MTLWTFWIKKLWREAYRHEGIYNQGCLFLFSGLQKQTFQNIRFVQLSVSIIVLLHHMTRRQFTAQLSFGGTAYKGKDQVLSGVVIVLISAFSLHGDSYLILSFLKDSKFAFLNYNGGKRFWQIQKQSMNCQWQSPTQFGRDSSICCQVTLFTFLHCSAVRFYTWISLQLWNFTQGNRCKVLNKAMLLI